MEDVLKSFLNSHVKLVKDDNFVIYGKIKAVHSDCILFFTDDKTIMLSFNRIKEIVPIRGMKK